MAFVFWSEEERKNTTNDLILNGFEIEGVYYEFDGSGVIYATK